MKSAYIRQPFFATFARYFDFVSVDGDTVSELAQAMARCAAVLAAGRSLLVFPEGTRAPGPRVLPFRDTAFRLAQAAGVPVVPVVVHTDVPVLGKRLARIAAVRRFRLTLRFLEPVRVSKEERPGDVAGRVERLLATHLAELDKGTVWEELAGVRPTQTYARAPGTAGNGEAA
jgi:1-acyl-sn-glycerol-3-phosphate acyltransferase